MAYRVKTDPETGQKYLATTVRGRSLLINPFANKGTAFTPEERRNLGLDGLLPCATCTMDQQLERAYENYSSKPNDIEKFIYLTSLHDRNETLFFRLLLDHIEEMMPIVYTPTVGQACQTFSHIYRRARGLYVGYDRRDEIPQVLENYHADRPSVIVVTDGERILGLGDQGAGGMGIPIGKLCLYTLCAGISPYTTLPVLLDVGTDNEEKLADPLYLGLRHRRIRGEAYQVFVDRFIEAVSDIYPDVLVQFEDFLKENAIRQLERFRDRICCFNDDIQGTAAVALSGVLASLRVTGQSLGEQRLVMAGAGASARGIADLLVSALVDQGVTEVEARRRIWMVDSRGLVTAARDRLEPFKEKYSRGVEELSGFPSRDRSHITLQEVITAIRPTILMGTSAVPGLFTEPIVRSMSASNERPVIFPLSNPTSRAECTPDQALQWSDGRAIVATGSPFPTVEREGQAHRIGQCNNSFIFPGVGLGVWVGQVRRVTDGMFLDAARALAGNVRDSDLASGAVFPELTRIREISHAVACAVIRRAVSEGHADLGILRKLDETVRDAMWYPDYLAVRYEPGLAG